MTVTFFLASEQSTENEANHINDLKADHIVHVVPRGMGSIEGYLTDSDFVAADSRAAVRVEAKNFLCRLYD